MKVSPRRQRMAKASRLVIFRSRHCTLHAIRKTLSVGSWKTVLAGSFLPETLFFMEVSSEVLDQPSKFISDIV